MAEKIGVGMIGAGFNAQFHIRSWVSVRDADINGIFDRNTERAQEAASLARVLHVGEPKIFSSVTEMVADPNIDAIWICSPNFTRIEVMEEIVNAVESGKGKLKGVACEKPLGRNVAEAKKMVELVKRAGLLDGYLENQLFEPTVQRGKDVIWKRGAYSAGRPYLARAAEEHGGPHSPWFWEGTLQGGGVMNDMMCHSVEVARFLLTDPTKPRTSLTPVKVTAHAENLKWQRPHYADILKNNSAGKLDYTNRPAEDYARSVVEYVDDAGEKLIVETSTSWCYVGAGLRLSMELLGPEYSMQINTLDTDLKVFFSRDVRGKVGEDLVEKQNAEIGLMPVVGNEENTYGYDVENRHMVRSFIEGKRPMENFEDGLNVTELLMTGYMSAEQEKTIVFPPPNLDTFVPKVAKGEWNPRGKK
ncbi:MAG: dehydrogenase [Stygiobacter sp. RIFOXYC12_FULL_38_8]|nr:MAG: dehydrogenase [Stygiobacter sp. GWC2_38_9]OGV07269.1 MAG: dehydrogenase [Stygiobacter sp. RIFOXYB2_FULL_37_11]OGV09937.1 MAG: dehydrogenase [Stygiobacter sp. RIFOXYA2_FULL_38_8]OGV15830.1 MAG: dehydrogenase [Stygiobacter sp. RIFOXYC2_FULL_38_25]OGV22799.1 MAG: dehydrogenase [Stygiobacter sp. RIFOXYC12_FULL_38_8]OGV80944.1 MAG: dehydrogenase [Stygiobacter sp. GWF2_38_21]RJQ57503.1 MAG: gfo/Idh/MocA family oxidoreductase [Stygiobacter sp.]